MSIDLTQIRAVVADMDGVLWRGEETLPGTPELFQYLHQQGIPYALATNNSTRTVQQYVDRVSALGVPITPEQIITSVVVTAEYLRERYPRDTPMYVLGSEAVETTLIECGYVLDPEEAKVVVVGLDLRLTYDRLRIAGQRILAGAQFIGTNGDVTLPIPGGKVIPGSGAFLGALQTMTGVAPLIMGKPQPMMFRVILERLGVHADEALMIGDRPESDILGAKGVGMKTALVLTGVTADETKVVPEDRQADGVYASLAGILEGWKAAARS
ncbi:MAG: HAD-IIA family hydrolase [Anaerolineae bacterium]|nr:HAD-IIA family hydrolase [Anaerolineae bacterium]